MIHQSQIQFKDNAISGDSMEIYAVAKRIHTYKFWEPIFICSNEAPLYEEILTWEGRKDKMTQVEQ